MKRLILLLGLLVAYVTSSAQYYHYEHYYACNHYINRVYHVSPVYMKVRKAPRVIVVEEENNVIYYHKKKSPQITHVYENNSTSNYNNTNDEIINIDDSNNSISYDKMWKQTIWFNEDAYKINKDYNKVTLDNVARFLKEHHNVSINVYGYASKKHGSYEYNKQLAANRCISTKNYMSSEYDISPSRIKICVRGTDNPEYYVDKWNQCVIIKCNINYE